MKDYNRYCETALFKSLMWFNIAFIVNFVFVSAIDT